MAKAKVNINPRLSKLTTWIPNLPYMRLFIINSRKTSGNILASDDVNREMSYYGTAHYFKEGLRPTSYVLPQNKWWIWIKYKDSSY